MTLHQVLHYLEDPEEAITEAARIMMPGGLLLVVDFEPHLFDEFRERYAHRRLGFSDIDITQWFAQAGIETVKSEHVETPEGKPNVKIWLGQKPQQIGEKYGTGA